MIRIRPNSPPSPAEDFHASIKIEGYGGASCPALHPAQTIGGVLEGAMLSRLVHAPPVIRARHHSSPPAGFSGVFRHVRGGLWKTGCVALHRIRTPGGVGEEIWRARRCRAFPSADGDSTRFERTRDLSPAPPIGGDSKAIPRRMIRDSEKLRFSVDSHQ